jgi:hypothetical protein
MPKSLWLKTPASWKGKESSKKKKARYTKRFVPFYIDYLMSYIVTVTNFFYV